MKKPWFRTKKYGWGWGLPATWQGWIVLLIYLVFIFRNFFSLDSLSHSVSNTIRPFVIQVIFASVVLIIIVYLTGEKPKWHWGNKDKR